MTDLVLEIPILPERWESGARFTIFDTDRYDTNRYDTNRNHQAGEMLDPGIGGVGTTGPRARFERALANNHRIVRIRYKKAMWASILRATTSALSSISPRPGGCSSAAAACGDHRGCSATAGENWREGGGRGGSFREARGGCPQNRRSNEAFRIQ
jgi:hypothetical protein